MKAQASLEEKAFGAPTEGDVYQDCSYYEKKIKGLQDEVDELQRELSI